jgi:hypothetical protein
MIDDSMGHESRHVPRRKQPAVMKEIKTIAGDADEQTADERRDHDEHRGRARATRRRD